MLNARVLFGLLLSALVLSSAVAEAHFNVNARNRIVLVERQDDAIRLTMRVPTPLIFAREITARASLDEPVVAPFVETTSAATGYLYYLDFAAIAADPETFGLKVASGYRFTVGGAVAYPEFVAVKVHRLGSEPPLTTPEEASAALAGPDLTGGSERVFVGDTTTDVALVFTGIDGHAPLEVVSALPAMELPGGFGLDNHFVDFRGDRVQVTNVPGQLTEPVLLDASLLRALKTFVVQGVIHIIEGPDHVLFVLCITIAALTFHRLLWQVTGFTLGHSVTLIAGFFGFTPAGAWFVPAVEAAIALSIVYAGLMAIFRAASPATVLVTTLIGLLHGFGFSFVLGGILGANSPHLLASLLSFNVGVEIGQLIIVTATLAVLAAVRWFGERPASAVRYALAGGAIAVACVWVVQRTDLLLSTFHAA